MPPPPRGPRQNPVTDIDRFLQEVDRLRRKAAAPEPAPRQDARFDEVLEVLPSDPAPKPPVVARPRSPRRFDDVEVVPVAQPAPQPAPNPTHKAQAAFPTTGVESIATVATIATIATISIPSAPQAAGQSRDVKSLGTVHVLSLLRGGNLKSAMMLREILDPPLSRRQRWFR